MSVIFGMSQVIGVVSADQGIESFVSRWVVVPDVELLRITFLGGYFFITKSGVNLVSPLRYHCRFFSGRSCLVLFVSFPALNNFESFASGLKQ